MLLCCFMEIIQKVSKGPVLYSPATISHLRCFVTEDSSHAVWCMGHQERWSAQIQNLKDRHV